ncbi:Xaa-Pro peptidase family protein [Metallumcola ferriviriculae]|uniref:Xaa-Pro peptidase family protein n=1 Tax=Metallumcola ferriviriculae TaxID=3039180 RepID=A0AAU0UJL3_9FIRM|nr:Xaa-Pro peptidase family protein [Desulfitibacteraceae bacterium MK1]
MQRKLQYQGIDCAIVLQSKALFYYTGTAQNAHLIVPSQGDPLLLVKKDFGRAREETDLQNVRQLESIKKLPDIVNDHCRTPARIGLEMDVLPAKNYLYYQRLFDGAELVDVSGLIRAQRIVKSVAEVNIIRESAARQLEVYRQIPDILREGMAEIELAAEVEAKARKLGHYGITPLRGFNLAIFYGHIMSGENGAVPSSFEGPTGGKGLGPAMPQSAGLRKIRAHEPVIVDYTGCYNGYIVDMTRVYSIGSLPETLVKAHRVAVDIQDMIAEKARPGMSCEKLYFQALDYAEKAGLKRYFLGYNYTLPFVGHGVGLELNELPLLARGYDQPLVDSSVIAIEPKFLFPGQGAVGIENTFLVTEHGLEKLTASNDEIIVI